MSTTRTFRRRYAATIALSSPCAADASCWSSTTETCARVPNTPHRLRQTAMEKIANRNVRARHWGDMNWPLNNGQLPNFRGIRLHVRTGYHRAEGNRRRREKEKGRVSSSSTRKPLLPLATFASLYVRVAHVTAHLHCSGETKGKGGRETGNEPVWSLTGLLGSFLWHRPGRFQCRFHPLCTRA
jgi:hypothetical protein